MRLNSLANGVQTNFSVWLMVGVSQTVSTYYYATIWRHQATMCWLINIDINVCLDTEINSLFGQFLSRFLINQIRFLAQLSLRDLMLKPAGAWMDPYFHLLIHCILIVLYCGCRGDRTAAKY